MDTAAIHADPNKRIAGVMAACLLLAGALVSRAAFIQLVGDPRLETLSRRQFQSKLLIRPRRGAIVDRNGEALAVSAETQSLAANPAKIKNRATLARLLSKATGISQQKILLKLREKREFVWIKRHIPEAELNQFRKWQLIDGNGDLASGLWLVKESQRVHPHGELAAHILGGVNIDSEGLEGVELWQNEKLRGKVGSVSAIKDALGRPTFMDAVAAKDVHDGEQIGLTIDASLQFEVERELKAAVQKASARGGTVIVMNAVDGEILAMANEPSFHPDQKGASSDRKRNRAITDGFEPGSTMKAVLAAGALSHGWKLSDQVWGERGEFKVQGRRISEAEAHEKFEWVSVKKMLQVSSNVAAAKIALKLGTTNYQSTLKTFGFGQKTKVGFPGEFGGMMPAKKEWQPLTLANVGFGQGLLATPIQMVRAYAAFLNGGWLVQPTLLKDNTKPIAPQRIISPRVAEQMLEALETVTQKDGTGIKAALEGYRVAGKTATAQAVDPVTKAYSRSRYIASFIGFALEVDPKIVIFTAIDEPRGIYYASETAAPLFREVLNAVANRFGLPTRIDPQDRVLAQAKAQKEAFKDSVKTTQAAVVPTTIEWQGASETGKMKWKMPLVKGLTPREAIRSLKGRKFQIEVLGSGLVKGQIPEEGKTIAEGDTIRLTLTE